MDVEDEVGTGGISVVASLVLDPVDVGQDGGATVVGAGSVGGFVGTDGALVVELLKHPIKSTVTSRAS